MRRLIFIKGKKQTAAAGRGFRGRARESSASALIPGEKPAGECAAEAWRRTAPARKGAPGHGLTARNSHTLRHGPAAFRVRYAWRRLCCASSPSCARASAPCSRTSYPSSWRGACRAWRSWGLFCRETEISGATTISRIANSASQAARRLGVVC